MSAGSSSRKRGSEKLGGSPRQAKLAKGKLPPLGTHPFFLKPSERPAASFTWNKPIGGSCLHGVHLDPVPSQKVAAFDLDKTLIKTKSGNDFPRDKDDWMWWRNSVPKKLRSLHEEGFAIVIISNQGSKSDVKSAQWKLKIPMIASQIDGVPFRIFAAKGHDIFRKPMPGMWTELEKLNEGLAIDKTVSFFVGDAAGRAGDHSDSDRKWALNIGLPFFTPEEYFLGSLPDAFNLKGFDPSFTANLPLFSPSSTPMILDKSHRPELVLFVGYPASGKTSLYRRYFQPEGYEHVNQDVLKTRNKCVKVVESLLKEGKSCVVDNTNRNVATRKEYINICKKLSIPVRCIHFTSSYELCWHNNIYRALCLSDAAQEQEPRRSLLPEMAFSSYKASYEEPTAAEGFMEIKRVNWNFEGSKEDRRRWSMWLEI